MCSHEYKEHAAVTGGKDEAVAVQPARTVRVMDKGMAE